MTTSQKNQKSSFVSQILDNDESKRYRYSKRERGKDGTINPNYYMDENGSHDLLWHVGRMFSFIKNVGFFQIVIIKYIKRFPGKHGVEDLVKARTYLDHLIKLVRRHNYEEQKRHK